MSADLSIVIVNWNTKELLKNCLESVYAATKQIEFEIFVVDNASSDGSAEMVKSEFGGIRLIMNSENMGFARANNVAFPLATGRYVLLLNSDTVVLPGALDGAVAFMDRHPESGALAPKILNSDGSIQHPCYVREPSLLVEIHDAFELARFFGRPDAEPAGDSVCEVAHACGAALFIRKAVLDKIGYLDETMVFSFEDADICIRTRREGWKLFHCPESEIVHLGGASRRKHGNRAVNATLYSKYRFYGKYHGRIYLAALAAVLVSSSILKLAIFGLLYLLQPKNREIRKLQMEYCIAVLSWHMNRKAGLGAAM